MQKSFQLLTVEGNTIKLPTEQLTDYADIKKVMLNNLGKYKGGNVMGFVFEYNPAQLLSKLQAGEKVNMKQDFHFFPTPPAVVDQMLQIAMPLDAMTIIEPSAGQGHIIEEVQKFSYAKHSIDAIELNPVNRKVLLEKGFNLIHDDFATFSTDKKYDLCLANPPFKHYIEHAYKMAEIAKEVCFIAPSSLLFANDKKTTALRNYILLENDGQIYNLNSGSFKSSGTMVESVIAHWYT